MRVRRHEAPPKSKRPVLLALAALVGLMVVLLFFAGRPLAFGVLKRLTVRKFPDVPWITTEELARWQADSTRPRAVVLDARTDAEFAVSHLNGAERVDPYFPSLQQIAAIPKDTPVVLYCSVGYRSARVADRLVRAGFTRVFNLEGSLFQWANEGRVVVANGVPATTVHPYDGRWGYLLKSKYRADLALSEAEKRSAAP